MCVGGESRHLDAMSDGKGTVGFYKDPGVAARARPAVVMHGRGHFGIRMLGKGWPSRRICVDCA